MLIIPLGVTVVLRIHEVHRGHGHLGRQKRFQKFKVEAKQPTSQRSIGDLILASSNFRKALDYMAAEAIPSCWIDAPAARATAGGALAQAVRGSAGVPAARRQGLEMSPPSKNACVDVGPIAVL
mmetsp:Transcript_140535/g.447996  ORF Transcript_140535/g.447996 Transcript_140535/m.447996 type:complete len:124 (+) Transcript_140535:606-977(+)